MILVRHAESEWNSHFGPTRVDPGIGDPDITSLGESQAMAASARLDDLNVGMIVSSPYRRTLRTAHLLRADRDIAIRIDPRVGERRVFSCDVGTPRAELAALWPDIDFSGIDDRWWSRRIESMASFAERCQSFIDEQRDRSREKITLVVTHWGFIRATTGNAVGNTDFVPFEFKTEKT